MSIFLLVMSFLALSGLRDSALAEQREHEKKEVQMTDEQKAEIIKAIMDRTTEWTKENRRRDAKAVLALFDDSAELRHVENGVIYLTEDLAKFVTGWYETTAEMDHSWEERRVLPLSPDIAIMTGVFRYEAKQKSGKVWSGRNVFTGVFVRRGNTWKVIQGHESSVPSSEPE